MIEAQKTVLIHDWVRRKYAGQRLVERDQVDAPFEGVAAAGGLYQELAHGARGDSFEVQRRGPSEIGGDGELDPGFVDESGRIQACAGIGTTDLICKVTQLLIDETETLIESGMGGRRRYDRSAMAHDRPGREPLHCRLWE